MLIEIPSQVNTAIKSLTDAGFEAYAVGGAVRDSIRGVSASDWDISTSALPQETEKTFGGYKIIETGIKHGTVTVIIEQMPLEITTFRIDGDYSDGRHPDKVDFTSSARADLSRRDFTVNAIAYNPQSGLLDPFGGTEDIKSKLIRCVGEADKRFGEDALRIMRALRFAAVLGYEIEGETAKSVVKNRALLGNIAAERIEKELIKLLCGKNTESILLGFDEVFFEIIPELRALKGCAQNHPYHCLDAWEHTVKAVAASPAVPEIRLALLLHDIGKPLCKTTDKNGIDHFHGHNEVSEEIARSICKRLKCSNKFTADVCRLVKYHDIQSEEMGDAAFKKWLGIIGESAFMQLFDIKKADIAAQSPEFSARLQKCDAAREKAQKLIDDKSCVTLRGLKVNGGDIIAATGKTGSEVGNILTLLLSEVIEGKTRNNKDELLKRAKEL